MSKSTRPGSARSLAALLAAGVLLLGACSSDGDDDTTSTTIAAATTVEPGATPGPRPTVTTTTIAPVVTVPEDDLTPAEEPYVTAIAEMAGEGVDRCSIVQFVDLVGAERLDAAGVDPADPPTTGFDPVLTSLDLSADEASALHDRMVACGHDFVGEMVDDLVSGRTDDPAVVSCLQDRIDPSAVRDAFVGGLQGLEFDEAAFEGLAECFDA